MLYLLLRPWSYLLINPYQKEKKNIDIYYPLALATLSAGVIWYTSDNVFILPNKESLIAQLANFFQILPGFYLAALSAIATFNQPDMDKAMDGTQLKLKIFYNNALTEIRLSRRRFLCVMFAYLTAQSFIFSILVAFFISLPTPSFIWDFIEFITISINVLLYFIFWQLLLITLWSLYYLGERIHTPPP